MYGRIRITILIMCNLYLTMYSLIEFFADDIVFVLSLCLLFKNSKEKKKKNPPRIEFCMSKTEMCMFIKANTLYIQEFSFRSAYFFVDI